MERRIKEGKQNKTCGCIYHGHAIKRTSTYNSWCAMRRRVAKDPDYKTIQICKRWFDFELFLEDMGEKPKNGWHIHRLDNAGDYKQSNCKWIHPKKHLRHHKSGESL